MIDLPTLLAPTAATLGLLLAVQLLARQTTLALVRAVGWHAVPWTTGWLGVPVHELSHALACVITRRRIRSVRLFAPDPASGTLGCVEFEPGRGPLAWLAGLGVGVAPLLGGTLALAGLLHAAAWRAGQPLPAEVSAPVRSLADLWQGLAATARFAIAASVAGWHAGGSARWLAVGAWYAAVAIAAHLTPSRSDLQGAWRGLVVASVLVVVAAGVAHVARVDLVRPLLAALLTACRWLAPGLALAVVPLTLLWVGAVLVASLRGR